MKTNGLPTNSQQLFNGSKATIATNATIATKATNAPSELAQFNNRRAVRGLMPITLEEFTEVSLKLMGFGSWNHQASMVH